MLINQGTVSRLAGENGKMGSMRAGGWEYLSILLLTSQKVLSPQVLFPILLPSREPLTLNPP